MDNGSTRGVAFAFWARVEQLRTAHELSVSDLARLAGVRRQTYGEMRRTTRRPRRDLVLSIAAAVGLDPAEALQLAGLNPIDTQTVRNLITATSDLDDRQKTALIALLDLYSREGQQAGGLRALELLADVA